MNNITTINNADVLRTVTCNHLIDGFKTYLKSWPTKFVGPVPSNEMLQVAVLFGKQHKCGPESGFIALQLRPEGASVAELCMAFNAGGAAHNHTKALCTDKGPSGVPGAGYFTRSKGGGRFYLTFTAKGIKALEGALKGMAVQQAAGEATVATDKPKAKKATKAPVGKKSTSKPRKGNGKGNNLHVPATLVTAELNASTLAAVEAELAERNAELEPIVEVVKPIDQPNA